MSNEASTNLKEYSHRSIHMIFLKAFAFGSSPLRSSFHPYLLSNTNSEQLKNIFRNVSGRNRKGLSNIRMTTGVK